MKRVLRGLWLFAALGLASCERPRDLLTRSFLEQHADEVPGWIAEMDATLADTGRAQRWRDAQRRWQEMKRAREKSR